MLHRNLQCAALSHWQCYVAVLLSLVALESLPTNLGPPATRQRSQVEQLPIAAALQNVLRTQALLISECVGWYHTQAAATRANRLPRHPWQ
jgi:hypothetical protein